MGDVYGEKGKKVFFIEPELHALLELRQSLEWHLYMMIRIRGDKVTRQWKTNWSAFAQLLGQEKGRKGERVIQRVVTKLENVGLLGKEAVRDGIVLTCLKAPLYEKSSGTRAGSRTGVTAGSKTGGEIGSQVVDLFGVLDVLDDESVMQNGITLGITDFQNPGPLSINNNNKNKKTRTRSLGRIDFCGVEDEEGGEPSEQTKTSAETDARLQQGTQIADGGTTVSTSGTEPQWQGRDSGTEPQPVQEPPTDAAGGVFLNSIAEGMLALAQYFLRKPGMGDAMPLRLQNGKFNAMFRGWLSQGMTVAEVIEICVLNDKLQGQVGYSPNWYNAAVLQAITDKKNPPALSSETGKKYGPQSQVGGKHHDRKRFSSQQAASSKPKIYRARGIDNYEQRLSAVGATGDGGHASTQSASEKIVGIIPLGDSAATLAQREAERERK